MPLSPLTRLLLGLTVLAFVPAFIWLEDEGKVASTMTGIAISLLVAAVFSMIRDNPPLGDRAFHCTRPYGNARAFRRITITLVILVAVVSLMAAARSSYHHLGEAVILRSTAIVFGYLGLISVGLAVGFALASDRSGSPRRIAVVMIALPVAVFLLIHESRSMRILLAGIGRRLGMTGAPQDWTMRISLAVTLGLAGFAVAWWLAAGKKRPRLALLVAGIIAAALPVLHLYGDLLPMGTTPPPDAQVTLTRGPRLGHTLPANSKDPGEVQVDAIRSRMMERSGTVEPLYLPFEGRITASGLRHDEVMSLTQLFPEAYVVSGYTSRSGSGWGGESGVLVDGGDFQAMFRQMAREVPGGPSLVPSRYQNISNWVSVKKTQAALDELENRTWTLNEIVYRLESAGGFKVASGGFGTLPSGGSVHVFPAEVNAFRKSLRLRLVLPDRGPSEKAYISVRVLLVDEATGRAWLPEVGQEYPQEGQTWGLASRCENWSILPNLPDFPGLTPEVLLRSTLYVFARRPIAKVSASLSPP